MVFRVLGVKCAGFLVFRVFRLLGVQGVLYVQGALCWVFRVLVARSSWCWVLGVKGAGCLVFRMFKVLGAGISGCSGCWEFRVLGAGCWVFRVLAAGFS